MSEKGHGWKYTDNCMACGRKLDGRGTKRRLLVNGYSIGYVCYGENICRSSVLRDSIIRYVEAFDETINLISKKGGVINNLPSNTDSDGK